MHRRHFYTAGVVLTALALSGCALFSSGAAQPVPIGTVPPGAGQPINPPTPTVVATPTVTAPSISAPPAAGEVIFERGGELWVIGVDGSQERQLSQLGGETSPTGLTLSPDGAYLAFVYEGQLGVLALASGSVMPVESVPASDLAFAWSVDSTSLYYWKVVFNPESTLPQTDQVWAAQMPPGGSAPQLILESSLADDPRSWLPRLALNETTVVVQRALMQTGDPGEWVLFNLADKTSTPLAEGYHVWDVSPDRSKVLLASQQDMIPSVQTPRLPLYIAELSPSQGAVNILMISPEDAMIYGARFAADSQRVIALQDIPLEDGRARPTPVLLTPAEGGYSITMLSTATDLFDLAVIWHPAGVIVQRWPVSGEGGPTLWLLPLDGQPGAAFAQGQSPLVVGGR